MYKVFQTEWCEKELGRLSKDYQNQIERIKDELAENPHQGKILTYPFFREKRICEKRLYYLIYDNWKAILIVWVGGKKTQQEVIDRIIELLPEYKNLVQKLVIWPFLRALL